MSNCPDNYESLEEWCSELEAMNDKLIAANRELQEENEKLKALAKRLWSSDKEREQFDAKIHAALSSLTDEIEQRSVLCGGVCDDCLVDHQCEKTVRRNAFSLTSSFLVVY